MNTLRQERSSPNSQAASTPVDISKDIDAQKNTESRASDAPLTQNAQTQRAKKATRNSRASLSPRIVEINLQEDGLLRGVDELAGKQRSINLSPERHLIRLQMLEGSASGRYTVSIVDAFGKPLIVTTANSDGRTLTVRLDLRILSLKEYRLCLARRDEAPDCYVVNISKRTRYALK
jgi:hypothetical protein